MKSLKGKFSITMPSSNRADRHVRLEIQDENSGTRFLKIEIALDVWTMATIGSMGYSDCEFVLRHTENVGKIREIKTERVRVSHGSHCDRDMLASEAIAPYEVDGWVGSVSDAKNHHRVVSHDNESNTYKVGFSRLVDDVEEANEKNNV